MAKKESRGQNGGYEALRAAIKAGVPANLYIFYGEERYLLQNMVCLLYTSPSPRD